MFDLNSCCNESVISISLSIIAEKLLVDMAACIYWALDISVNLAIQQRGLANAPNLTLLVVGYFFPPPALSSTVAN